MVLDEKARPIFLGGMTHAEFLREYWQKKPLLIRNAFPNFVGPLSKAEIFELATRDEAEARVFQESSGEWSVLGGPFTKAQLGKFKKIQRPTHWTMLVQDTQHFSFEAHSLLSHFGFIGNARIDDLMVSYAPPGGGVGAHFDSYDVFLLQGLGSRRWQISEQHDLTLDLSRPVKALKNFVSEQEWILETGDMLYLPPHVAHHGVAMSECITWSIGFRAPSQREIVSAYLADMSELVPEGRAFSDPDRRPTDAPGCIDTSIQKPLRSMTTEFLRELASPENVNDFIGRYLTQPKAHVFFPEPEKELSQAAFAKRATRDGVHLDLCTRALFDKRCVFINGERHELVGAAYSAFVTLANKRMLVADVISAHQHEIMPTLYESYLSGYLHLGLAP